jgi:protein TonB
MNKPLAALKPVPDSETADKRHSDSVIPLKLVIYKTGRSLLPAGGTGLADFRTDWEGGERRPSDYVLIALLAILVHVAIVRFYHDAASRQEPATPPKVPPMVQVTLLAPPPAQPVAAPPPPPAPPPPKKAEPPPKKDVVALKPEKPKPKPKPVAKPVVRRAEPVPQPTHSEPVEEPSPAPTARETAREAPPPPPPVVEKLTPPSASAGYLHNPAPDYPEQAEEMGWAGRVLLKVHVLASGRPDSVVVQKSSGHEILDQAAARTVRSAWHFAPAMRGNTPTDGWVTVPITFSQPG